MSDFVLQEHGDGRFSLGGQVSFHTAETILRESARLFAAHDRIRIDLSAVERTDSAGLALLLEWISQASQSGKQIAFDEIPEKIHAIAETAEIDELLMRSHSASSDVDSASDSVSSNSVSSNSSSSNSSSSKK